MFQDLPLGLFVFFVVVFWLFTVQGLLSFFFVKILIDCGGRTRMYPLYKNAYKRPFCSNIKVLKGEKMKNTKSGFTLIELLVVVLIIGILSSVALPQYTKAVEKARLTELQTNQTSLEKAADIYLLANGFPSANNTDLLDSLDVSFPDFSNTTSLVGWHCNSKGTCISVTGGTNYVDISVAKWPKDDMTGAPNYALYSRKESVSAPWTRTYSSCRGDISKFGLEAFGYTAEAC